MIQVRVKSGTNGHIDYDNCDLFVADIPTNNIPAVGDILFFGDEENNSPEKYLVREVERSYNRPTDKLEFSEWITVYVINA